RGPVRSRSRGEVVEEARRLVDAGFRELVLCGIHLGHYGRDTGDSVLGLARAVAALPGSFRVRLSSLEITEIDADLARALADTERLVPHLHVPLQSGDDGVLRAMRRPYTAARFADRIETVRAAVEDLALTTDVIVGFPGETEEAFERTLALARRLRLSRIHVFPFSPRAGTEAARLEGRVPAPTLRSRVARLLREERRLREEDDRSRIGTEATVLVESTDGTTSEGLSERYRRIRLPGEHPPSTFVRCRVVGRGRDDELQGEPCP
ncbi:MAG: radical SAM protein, partial [Planctomycetota bacterium JB042]